MKRLGVQISSGFCVDGALQCRIIYSTFDVFVKQKHTQILKQHLLLYILYIYGVYNSFIQRWLLRILNFARWWEIFCILFDKKHEEWVLMNIINEEILSAEQPSLANFFFGFVLSRNFCYLIFFGKHCSTFWNTLLIVWFNLYIIQAINKCIHTLYTQLLHN